MNVSGFIRLCEEGKIPNDKVTVILRHDVDSSTPMAKEISILEKKHNITSTYYIRTRGNYNPLNRELYDWINWLNDNGFEVGLHYEELYYTNYSFPEAVKLFSEDLELLRTMSKVVTVCSHGNIQNQLYINYEIFSKNYTTLQEHGLLGEAYLSIFNNAKYNVNIAYFSDSNGKWEDWFDRLQKASDGEVIYFTFHPEYWNK